MLQKMLTYQHILRDEYVRTCLLVILAMMFVHVLGLSPDLDIYMKNAVCTQPVRFQGWCNSAGGEVCDFCRQASEWRLLILQLFVS